MDQKYHGTFFDKLCLMVMIILFVVLVSVLNLKIQSNEINENNENQIYVYNKNMEMENTENIKFFVNDSNLNFFYEIVIRFELEKHTIGGEPAELTGKTKERGDSQIAKIGMNKELSDRLSYNRILLDVRNKLCKKKTYDIYNLPTTSVIIIYYNEPYSVIIRTVHSIFRTADQHLLKEIILVDDGSTNVEIKGKLHYYVKTRFLENVQILTLEKRRGLIRARMAGARLATGDILLFMDAHCECILGWLEPLVERIKLSRTSVVTPINNDINMQHLIGGFNWDGHFDWIPITKYEVERIKRECDNKVETCPIRSPTMSGGIFAINREYFWEMGGYDEQMKGWAVENLEMSFRIWQCGGSIETIPCSVVGHVTQELLHFNIVKSHAINTLRMAKVWMDKYINILYMYRPDFKLITEVGDVTNRKVLREKLKCKSFNWYLKNVYPQKFIPIENVQGYGQVRSINLCLDDLQQNKKYVFKLGVLICDQDKNSLSQFFSLTNDGVLRTEYFCAVANQKLDMKNYVEMVPCKDHNAELWSYLDGNLIHLKTGLCLGHQLQSKDFVQLTPCKPENEAQKWFIEH